MVAFATFAEAWKDPQLPTLMLTWSLGLGWLCAGSHLCFFFVIALIACDIDPAAFPLDVVAPLVFFACFGFADGAFVEFAVFTATFPFAGHTERS